MSRPNAVVAAGKGDDETHLVGGGEEVIVRGGDELHRVQRGVQKAHGRQTRLLCRPANKPTHGYLEAVANRTARVPCPQLD